MMAQARRAYPDQSIRALCALLGINRAGFYRQPREPGPQEVALRDAIEWIVLQFPGYGYRRVTQALKRDGWAINHKRVLRVMREEALLCQLKRRFVPTTDSTHAERRYPNLLKAAGLDAPNQAWVADITYIRLPTTFVYLAAILDAYSRYCVGWHLSRWIDTQLTLAALEQAVATRRPAAGWIHHSDQGMQYASSAYVARLEGLGARISMAGAGNPYENAKAERFFPDPQARGGVPESLRDLRGCRRADRPLYRRRVQHQAAPFEPGVPAASGI